MVLRRHGCQLYFTRTPGSENASTTHPLSEEFHAGLRRVLTNESTRQRILNRLLPARFLYRSVQAGASNERLAQNALITAASDFRPCRGMPADGFSPPNLLLSTTNPGPSASGKSRPLQPVTNVWSRTPKILRVVPSPSGWSTERRYPMA